MATQCSTDVARLCVDRWNRVATHCNRLVYISDLKRHINTLGPFALDGEVFQRLFLEARLFDLELVPARWET